MTDPQAKGERLSAEELEKILGDLDIHYAPTASDPMIDALRGHIAALEAELAEARTTNEKWEDADRERRRLHNEDAWQHYAIQGAKERDALKAELAEAKQDEADYQAKMTVAVAKDKADLAKERDAWMQERCELKTALRDHEKLLAELGEAREDAWTQKNAKLDRIAERDAALARVARLENFLELIRVRAYQTDWIENLEGCLGAALSDQAPATEGEGS